MSEMTITRALSELKLLEKKINDKTGNALFIDVFQKKDNKALHSNKSVEDFQKASKAALQEIQDLIDRRNRIKSAIVKSNASVAISIGSKTYLVVEAIERKNSIRLEQNLLNNLVSQRIQILNEVERNRVKVEQQVEALLQTMMGKDNKKFDKETYASVAGPVEDANLFQVSDPNLLEDLISKMRTSIDEFLNNVDFALSESNAKTTINVD